MGAHALSGQPGFEAHRASRRTSPAFAGPTAIVVSDKRGLDAFQAREAQIAELAGAGQTVLAAFRSSLDGGVLGPACHAALLRLQAALMPFAGEHGSAGAQSPGRDVARSHAGSAEPSPAAAPAGPGTGQTRESRR